MLSCSPHGMSRGACRALGMQGGPAAPGLGEPSARHGIRRSRRHLRRPSRASCGGAPGGVLALVATCPEARGLAAAAAPRLRATPS
eukprot:12129261-Alexandrium_andersonii.AAC.1